MHSGRRRSGIWFLSLDAARLPAVLAARVGYRLPSFWSEVRVRVVGDRIRYRCRRRYLRRGARCDAEPRLGRRWHRPSTASSHFSTVRYRLFAVIAGKLAAAEAEYRPWPLCRAEVLRLDQDLLYPAGLPTPASKPGQIR